MKFIRVLVVDDSVMNRRVLSELLSAMPGVEVAGTAADGDQALRLAMTLKPDLITLDLEMPRMDGFSFLRLLMASRPTPVFIVSGHSAKENVFRALELGAIDFLAKPKEGLEGDLSPMRAQLEDMIALVRQLTPASLEVPQRTGQMPPRTVTSRPRATRDQPRLLDVRPPRRIVVVAASTGGPTALLEVFARLPGDASASIIVAQHMPDRFTRTFAERLDRLSAFRVAEAAELHQLVAGGAWVCPGGKSIEVVDQAGQMAVRVVWPTQMDRYAPSADRLFSSAAAVAGSRVIAVVLTGMGDDGAAGVADVKKAGGTVLVEAEETAVVYGMPGAAARTGRVDQTLPLRQLAERLAELVG